MTLPTFPVDEVTLLAVEHAMGSALTYDDEQGNPLPPGEGPRRIGADYSLPELLDFLAGCAGQDPNRELLSGDEALAEHGLGGPLVYYDTRIHYTHNDLIQALINEVRRLRDGGVTR